MSGEDVAPKDEMPPRPRRPIDPKPFNESLKEFCAFVRGIALAVIIFGAIRGGVDPEAWLGSTRFGLSVLAGVALQSANLYILRTLWRKE